MRLWHQALIPYLPRQQLLGQHRECCALRGKGWGKKHSVVDYVFKYNPAKFVAYHCILMDEMERRGYNPNLVWKNYQWRGSILGKQEDWAQENAINNLLEEVYSSNKIIFKEHNQEYLQECLDNLKSKGIEINF